MGDIARYDTYTHCSECCLWSRHVARRRERIATALLAGMLAGDWRASGIVREALAYADELIAALDAEPADD